MTPEKVIEALENEIHLVEWVDGLYAENISIELLKDILDFINSQQAEMDKIKKEKDKSFEKWKLLADKTEQHYSELYEEAIEIAKFEAVKEFAEKLKEEAVTRLHYGTMLELEETECVEVEEIDNILKKWWGKSDV